MRPKPDRQPLEPGAVKKSWADRVPVALLYPNSYRVAMASLGYHQVYHLINAREEFVCERVVLPESGPPRSIESGKPLTDFEIIAVSISYEEDALNLARMLLAGRVPLDIDARDDYDSPLIVAGGVIAFLNPEPIAAFCDAVAVGEAEVILPGILDRCLDLRDRPRDEILCGLTGVAGVYVPSLYEVGYGDDGGIERRVALSPAAPEAVAHLVAPDLSGPARTRIKCDAAEFGDLMLVELGRGCPHGCRFCAGSFLYRPPRWTPAEAVAAALAERPPGLDRAGLLAAAVTGHPEFQNIREGLAADGLPYSLASLRLDEVTADLLDELVGGGAKSVTLAPEAGSERLRRIINKDLSDEQIEDAMAAIGAAGIRRVKLYFQVGLPTETAADLEACGSLLKKMQAALARGAPGRNWLPQVTVSANPFVPKPATPFQWEAMARPEELRERLGALKQAAGKAGMAFGGSSVPEALFQAWVSRGDRRVGAALAKAVDESLDGRRALKLKMSGLPPADWYLHRERDRAEVFPWDFITHGCDKKFLWGEREKSRSGKLTPPCRPGECKRCAACGG